MARIIIVRSSGGPELEVDQTAFNNGFFPGFVYVRDASGSPTSPLTPLAADMNTILSDSASAPSTTVRAAFASERDSGFQPPSAYLCTTFDSNLEDLRVYTSTDGKDFATNPLNPVFTAATGGVRDPSIIFHSGYFYAAITTARSVAPSGTSFDILRSTDPATAGSWTNIATVDCTAATNAVPKQGGVPNTWAPALFVDDDGTVYVYISINQAYIFVSHATNLSLTAWSAPAQVTFNPTHGLTFSYLDADVIKIGGTYHLHFKANNYGKVGHATSRNPAGPFVDYGFLTWPSFVAPAGNGYEGPCVVRVEKSRWRLYVDVTDGSVGMSWTESTDPNLDVASWGPLSVCTINGAANASQLRHGTALGLGSAVVDAKARAIPALGETTRTALRLALNAMTGGGVITVGTGGTVKWTQRLLVVGVGGGPHFSTDGYFDITMPPDGTVISGYGGPASYTVAGGVIPLPGFHALYYVLPIGSGSTSVAGNFRRVSYGAFVVPDNWILIAVNNADNNQVRFGNGASIPVGSQWSSSTGTIVTP